MKNETARPDGLPEDHQTSGEGCINMAVFEQLANEANQKAAVYYLAEEIAELRAEIVRVETELSDEGLDTAESKPEVSAEGSESELANEQDELWETAEAIMTTSVWFDKCDRLEQGLIDCIQADVTELTAPSYLAAMILAGRKRRPEVVFPYLGRWVEMFYEAKFPIECHELTREIFKAVSK